MAEWMPAFKTVPLLMKQMKGRRGIKNFVSRAGERSCRCGLTRAEGRKGAAARGEGRNSALTTELSNEASRRPSGQRAAAPFHAAERR